MSVFLSVLCCQVKVSASGRSLVQRRPYESLSPSLIRCNNNLYIYNGYADRGQDYVIKRETGKEGKFYTGVYFGLLRSWKMGRDAESLGAWIPTFGGNIGIRRFQPTSPLTRWHVTVHNSQCYLHGQVHEVFR